MSAEEVIARRDALHEFNPMLGHRGVRLGLSFPEIYSMQISAVLEAAGIQDILTKSLGSPNAHNVVKATMNGLRSLRTKQQALAYRGAEPAPDKGE